MVHSFNLNTPEAEAVRSLSLRPAWSTKWHLTLKKVFKNLSKQCEHNLCVIVFIFLKHIFVPVTPPYMNWFQILKNLDDRTWKHRSHMAKPPCFTGQNTCKEATTSPYLNTRTWIKVTKDFCTYITTAALTKFFLHVSHSQADSYLFLLPTSAFLHLSH